MSCGEREKAAEIGHTPEPWYIDRDERVGMAWNNHIASLAKPNHTICFMSHDGTRENLTGEANARRIVACVNACEDILDYELSLGCVARLSEQLRTITKQRDELLSALERSLESFEYIAKYGNSCGHSQLRIPDLKAVIASVKEG